MSAGGCDRPAETLLLRKPQSDIRNHVHCRPSEPSSCSSHFQGEPRMLMMHFGRHGESKRHGIEEVPSLLVQRRTKLSLSGRIKRALRATGYSALRTIEVVVQGRCVVLQGLVPRYHMKQIAQVVTLAVPGVQQLCNDVEVIPPAAPAQTGLDGCSFVVNQKREAS
jgi:hypothetical protein